MEENKEFKCFDVVSDDSDHHFLNKNDHDGNCFTNSKSGVYKHIMKEWKILEPNLPESIYVRAYERRIDLMRAVIVGAAGTPYHDGLFFFDIAFPSNYPHKPPKIHFHSFGYRLNPNLYSNGYVCLSLVNTWVGKKEEQWEPFKSTLFQVLLSIQALVLNEKPLSNEPGLNALSRYRFMEGTIREYNQRVFTITCQISLRLVRIPPKNFEAFVKDHFRLRGFVILMACKEYANGRVRVGYYNYNNNNKSKSSSSNVRSVKVSPFFLKSLEGVYGQMYHAFVGCGAPLGPSFRSLELEAKPSKSKKVGIFKKAIAKIKQSLGWKSTAPKHEG